MIFSFWVCFYCFGSFFFFVVALVVFSLRFVTRSFFYFVYMIWYVFVGLDSKRGLQVDAGVEGD